MLNWHWCNPKACASPTLFRQSRGRSQRCAAQSLFAEKEPNSADMYRSATLIRHRLLHDVLPSQQTARVGPLFPVILFRAPNGIHASSIEGNKLAFSRVDGNRRLFAPRKRDGHRLKSVTRCVGECSMKARAMRRRCSWKLLRAGVVV